MRWPTPAPAVRTLAICSFPMMDRFFCQGTGQSLGGTAASAVWPVANQAIYLPFELEASMVATEMWTYNGATAAGTVDIGIYAEDGTKLVSMGATAQSGINAIQKYNITDTLLGRGRFYLGLSLSSGTATLFRFSGAAANDWLLWGALQQATAHPLPASATFASNVTLYLPLCGFGARLI